ncbi:hypothetical protein TRIP_E80005 [uncultured Spirochaetota bacterium]|uniref:Uncharacterized protein n=1 Tax=uncultured Spirochaetota bacterium TaxID=460511 RepID=A0A652ZZG6_9SPIR|nr:hypothetical protein TRIP_E80005 [uncultured Spirochaetota bacterium]
MSIWKEGFDNFRLNNTKSSLNKHFNYDHLILQRFKNHSMLRLLRIKVVLHFSENGLINVD